MRLLFVLGLRVGNDREFVSLNLITHHMRTAPAVKQVPANTVDLALMVSFV
jgi:hypothetical protein